MDIDLTRPLSTYNPRACDCDYCRKHGAAYVSDAQGALLIRVNDQQCSGRYRQGSALAEFLLCKNCGVLVAVLYRSDARIYACVNAKTIDGREDFGAEQSVSPKKLSGPEKMLRWKEVWFSKVEIVAE